MSERIVGRRAVPTGEASPRYGERDVHDTGERHLVLAAIRLLMADACVEAGKVVDEE